MKQLIHALHRIDDDNNPAGGSTTAVGLRITWQDGPLQRGDERLDPNGCFVETVIAAALDRLEFYQLSRFACHENAMAIESLRGAVLFLESRTADREARGVEGTHEV